MPGIGNCGCETRDGRTQSRRMEVSTKQLQIAELAATRPEESFTSLNHYLQPVRGSIGQPASWDVPPLYPVVDDPDTDLKVSSQFFDGKFFGSLQNRRWDFVAITNPIDHAIGEWLAFGAA